MEHALTTISIPVKTQIALFPSLLNLDRLSSHEVPSLAVLKTLQTHCTEEKTCKNRNSHYRVYRRKSSILNSAIRQWERW